MNHQAVVAVVVVASSVATSSVSAAASYNWGLTAGLPAVVAEGKTAGACFGLGKVV